MKIVFRPSSKQFLLFWMMFFFILTISCLDMYLICRYQGVIILTEKNYFGTLLLQMDAGRIGLFCATKMFGTCLALAIWKKIWFLKRKWGWVVGIGLCVFQLLLVLFLFHEYLFDMRA